MTQKGLAKDGAAAMVKELSKRREGRKSVASNAATPLTGSNTAIPLFGSGTGLNLSAVDEDTDVEEDETLAARRKSAKRKSMAAAHAAQVGRKSILPGDILLKR